LQQTVLIHIDTHSGTPIYRQVIDQVTAMVMTGQLAAGDQLESVAALSKRIRVNPMTVSKAYSQLVNGGLLERRPGIGLFVGDFEPADRAAARDALLGESMSQAAGLAGQLGLDEAEATELFKTQFRKAIKTTGKKT
jgi:GntR family transcriptional regulator